MSKIRFTISPNPGNPPVGKVFVYVDQSDSHIKTRDSSGTVFDLTNGDSQGENAIVAGSTNVTVISGSNTTSIKVAIPPAIIGGAGIAVVSGSNTVTISSNVSENAIIGTDGITVVSGFNTTTIQGFKSEFVSASGFIQTQINNLDTTYATDLSVTSISGHLQTAIDAVETGDVDSINSVTGAVLIAATGYSSTATLGQTISINTPIPNALVGGSNVSIVSGTSTTIITSAQPPAIIGGSNITVVSGANTTTISSTAGTPAAIVGDAFINVISGSNFIQIAADALTGSDGIVVSTGTNTVNFAGFFSQFVSASGFLQTQISTADADVISLNSLQGALTLAGTNIGVASGGSTITLSAPVTNAIVSAGNIIVTSGTSATSISAGVPNALIGSNNVTIISGSNTTTITSSQPPAIISGDTFLNVVSGTNVVTITSDAIISSDANLTVTSGTNTLTLNFSSTPSFTSVSATTITGTTGQFSGTISAERGEFSQGLTVSGIPVTTAGGGGGTPGGSNTQVQFNDSGAFQGDAGLIYNKTTDTLTSVTYSGTAGQFAGALSGQSGTFSASLTVSGVPVFLHHIFQISADQLDSPVTADWLISQPAPTSPDSLNSALSVKLFDDTTEEGAGWILTVPPGTSKMLVKLKSRAETAPAGTRTVGTKLYKRKVGDNTAVSAWDSGTVMLDLSFPTNTNFQYDFEEKTLSSWGLIANTTYQFELTRINPTAGTELTGDWALLMIELEFR